MTSPVVLLESAETDLAEAKTWYRDCHPSLEADFSLCVEHTLDHIAASPLSYPCIHGDFRRALIRRFPYRVIFRLAARQIVVVAVLHTRRDPRIWQARGH